MLYRNSSLCFKIQRKHEGFKRNGEHDDYTQSAKEVFKCQFSDLLSVKFCQFIFLIQLRFFMFQVKCMSLLILPFGAFGAFKFLWANAHIKCGSANAKGLIYVTVELYSHIFLIHVMGILNKISKELLILFIDSKHFRLHKITNTMPCMKSQFRYLPL